MGYFRIMGEGPHSPSPLEAIVETAVEARSKFYEMQRLCGRVGRVSVYGEQGKPVSLNRLDTLANLEGCQLFQS